MSRPTRKKYEKHGQTSGTVWGSEILVLYNIKQKCYNPQNPTFYRHGAIGIRVCQRWLKSLKNFLNDMGKRPEGTELVRLDDAKDFTPTNCAWTTISDSRLMRGNTRLLTIRGKTAPMVTFVTLAGAKYTTVFARLKAGWEPEEAVFREFTKTGKRLRTGPSIERVLAEI